jgi:hypothetical protein
MGDENNKKPKSNQKIKINEQFGENLTAQEKIKKGMTIRSKPTVKPSKNDKK